MGWDAAVSAGEGFLMAFATKYDQVLWMVDSALEPR